ncbi:alpha/beta fold hydrolase [Kitasatospora sp. NPDC058063]|uniref:alpha/beta fold hydrolase n=1 Tax=unclassified Kitasatospora TaxID=2633591 RepID=UPI0036D7A511
MVSVNGPTPFGQPGLGAALAARPALALWGAADRTLAARHFLPLFAEAFPRGRIVELPGVGHCSPEDAPDAVGDLVQRFLAETETETKTEAEAEAETRGAA